MNVTAIWSSRASKLCFQIGRFHLYSYLSSGTLYIEIEIMPTLFPRHLFYWVNFSRNFEADWLNTFSSFLWMEFPMIFHLSNNLKNLTNCNWSTSCAWHLACTTPGGAISLMKSESRPWLSTLYGYPKSSTSLTIVISAWTSAFTQRFWGDSPWHNRQEASPNS